jgi:nicotinate phosphoribosyltransferase
MVFDASTPNRSELAAFAALAQAFPDHFLALIDTYDVKESGLPNFCAVAMALHDSGHVAKGVQIDSGDVTRVSAVVRSFLQKASEGFDIPWLKQVEIVTTNANPYTLMPVVAMIRQTLNR